MNKYQKFKQEIEASGMSAKAYGASKKMSANQVYYWLRKARAEKTKCKKLVSIELVDDSTKQTALPVLKISTRYGTLIEVPI